MPLSGSQNSPPKTSAVLITASSPPYLELRLSPFFRPYIRSMAPPDGYMYLLRGRGASLYPSMIIKALILLRLRKAITNFSGPRPTLSWILYLSAILFNLIHLLKSLQALGAPRKRSNRQVDGGSNNKDNPTALPPSNEPSIVNQFLRNIIWPTMAARSRPPTDFERRLYKIRRDINTSAIGHLDRAVDRMAVALTPNVRFANLDFNGPAATATIHSRPGGQIMHYHANSNIQTLSNEDSIPAVHQHPENQHMYRYFSAIPDSPKDKNYQHSIYSIRTQIDPYPPSTGRDLEPTVVRNLITGERHFGQCIVVKTVLTPKHLDATHVLIEDEAGKWDLLNIFNSPFINHEEDRIGQGQLMIIKEPLYCKVYGGIPAIRVDHPSDIQYIMYDHPLVPDKWKRKDAHGLDAEPKVLKMDGELRMRWKKYHQAIDCLNLSHRILERTYQETQKNFSRPSSFGTFLAAKTEITKLRVGCYYYLEQWEKCHTDANAIINLTFNEKAAWYKANALFQMNAFDEAKQVILRIMGGSRYKFKECSKLHSQIRNYQNNAMGQYNMVQLLERGKEGQHEICAGDFISGVKVKRSPVVGGYGLFTQKDFKPGELIMAVKALATVYGSENSALHVKDQNGEFVKTTYGQKMVAKTIARIIAEPRNVGILVQKLNRKQYEGTFFKHDGEVIINGFWVDDTIENCAMQHNIYNKRIPDSEGILDPEIFPDMAHDEETFTPTGSANRTAANGSNISIDGSHESQDIPRDPGLADQASFFPQAAYINHSCVPNARISIFSDILFVYAAAHIRKEEEVFVNYLDDYYSPLIPRREILRDQFGFNCRCSLCEYEGDNFRYWGERTNFHEAIGDLMNGNYAQNPAIILDGISQCMNTMKHEFQDTAGDFPQFDMAWAYMVEEYFRRKVEHAEKRTSKTAELRNMKLALLMLRSLGAEYEFVEGDVKVLRYGFVCKWLVEAWILAAISSARFYGGVFWTLRVIARDVYGILCGETVSFEKLFWGRLEEAEVAELTEEEMLSMTELVEWLKGEGLEKSELVG
ncbi:hypothetical protein TWF281_001526 [Arthrobotrys megalospora]